MGHTYYIQTTSHLQGDKEEHYFSPVMLSQGPERKKGARLRPRPWSFNLELEISFVSQLGSREIFQVTLRFSSRLISPFDRRVL